MLLLITVTILFIIFLLQLYIVRSDDYNLNDTKRIISIVLTIVAVAVTIIFIILSIR